MKALSLWQPWASAIALGRKRIETRHWSTAYRGPLLIHAAKRPMSRDEIVWFNNDFGLLYEVQAMGFFHATDMANQLPYGAIVAACQLVDVIPVETILDLGDYTPTPNAERLWGDYSAGRFAWVLRDIVAIDPIPATGHQGLWDFDDAETIRRALANAYVAQTGIANP